MDLANAINKIDIKNITFPKIKQHFFPKRWANKLTIGVKTIIAIECVENIIPI
jgi:alpha-amylase/alpha-mannosidase (GH57 family)